MQQFTNQRKERKLQMQSWISLHNRNARKVHLNNVNRNQRKKACSKFLGMNKNIVF